MMDSAANKSEQEISLKDLFINIKQWGVYLFSKWYILLIAGFFGAGIGILYSKVKKTDLYSNNNIRSGVRRK